MKIIIADDEKLARDRLKRLLQAYPQIEVIREAENGKEVLKLIEQHPIDLIFLDIEMPILNGIEVAGVIKNNPTIKIVFATAYDEFAIKAFELHAIDYLLKPITQDRLDMAMQKIKTQSSKEINLEVFSQLIPKYQTAHLALKSGKKYFVIKPEKIISITAKDHYAEISTDQEKILVDNCLDSLFLRLNPEKFIRIHRSSIINLDFVTELHHEGDRKYLAILNDEYLTELPISRENIEKVKTKLGLN